MLVCMHDVQVCKLSHIFAEMDGLIQQFCDFWTQNLPDMSDYPDIPYKSVQFWKKKKKSEKVNKHKRKREHVTLKGT